MSQWVAGSRHCDARGWEQSKGCRAQSVCQCGLARCRESRDSPSAHRRCATCPVGSGSPPTPGSKRACCVAARMSTRTSAGAPLPRVTSVCMSSACFLPTSALRKAPPGRKLWASRLVPSGAESSRQTRSNALFVAREEPPSAAQREAVHAASTCPAPWTANVSPSSLGSTGPSAASTARDRQWRQLHPKAPTASSAWSPWGTARPTRP